MAHSNMEKNLLHRMILLLLTSSTIYHLYKSFTHYNNDSHKNINSLTVTLGSKLNLSVNNRIGYSLPPRTKNCVKTRNLILIFLAMSANVHSNPGPQTSRRDSRHSSKSSSRPTRNKVTSLPDWISNLSQSSRRSLMHIKNLQRKLIKEELHSDFLQKYKNNEWRNSTRTSIEETSTD